MTKTLRRGGAQIGPQRRFNRHWCSSEKWVVTLAGFVRSFAYKFVAESAAKRVMGVVGLANDLEVRLRGADKEAVIQSAFIAPSLQITPSREKPNRDHVR
jgi:hypothetical protein